MIDAFSPFVESWLALKLLENVLNLLNVPGVLQESCAKQEDISMFGRQELRCRQDKPKALSTLQIPGIMLT